MTQQRPSGADTGGFSLFSTLALSTFIALFSVLYSTVVMLVVNTNQMHAAGRLVYWLSRSEAVSMLAQLQNGQLLPSHLTVSASDGSIDATATKSVGHQWTVDVTARNKNAVNTIEFIYNTVTAKCTLWRDNRWVP